MDIVVYTDGACNGSKIGGWAYVLNCLIPNSEKPIDEVQRAYRNAAAEMTNQRAELMAVLVALKNFTRPAKFTIRSDSAYIVNCFLQGWHKKWMINGWTNSSGDPVANQDLWKQILHHMSGHEITWEKVKGHDGDFYNEYADKIAKLAVQQYMDPTMKPYDGYKLGEIFDPLIFPPESLSPQA